MHPNDASVAGSSNPNRTTGTSGRRQIGRFQVLQTIGSGGFATVYRAEDDELGREVALKVLHPHLAADQDFVRRFREEARAAARLHHPNIVRIYDASITDDGRPYLVMELLDGTLLSDLLTPLAPRPLVDIVSIVTQLASALDYLHANGLIHRDLKPSNVMVDRSGVATLMDFGVARSLYAESRLTLPGQLFGTPTYMAPELTGGGPVTAAADIYSLGILTYEMLAGRPPFEGNTQRILYAHVYEQPSPLTDISDSVSRAVQRALEKDPGHRYASAGELAVELARALPSVARLGSTLAGEDGAALIPPASRPASTLAGEDGAALMPPASRPASTLAGEDGAALIPPASGTKSTLADEDETTLFPVASRQRTLAGQEETPLPPSVRPSVYETPLRDDLDITLRLPAYPAGSSPPSGTTLAGRTIAPVVSTSEISTQKRASVARAALSAHGRGRLVALAGLVGVLILGAALAAALILARHHARPVVRAKALPPVATRAAGAASAVAAAPAANITMRITAPANGATVYSTVIVSVEESGAIIKAATENDPNAAHFHYFIDRDPATVLKPGQPIPTGQPDIIHTTAASLAIPDLKLGQHTVWVVLAHTDHTPFSPNIESSVKFTVVPVAGAVQTIAGSGSQGFADGAGATAQLNTPSGVAVDSAGNVYVADTGNSRIRKITPGGVSTIAGSGQFDGPRGIAVDQNGNLYVTDTGNNQIRKITPDGTVTTLAGSGSVGLGGGGLADGTGTQAQFRQPIGVAVDGAGNVYVSDTGNNRIRKITADGRVTTIAGSAAPGSGGFADGPGASARFNAPRGIAVDAGGNIYVADTLNQRIRKVTPDGVVSTLAGSGDQGTASGAAAVASFSNPDGVAVDGSGDIYVADNSSFRIREITASGVVVDVAGTAREGFLDGAPASAQFDFPAGLAVDLGSNVYVADSLNNRIRKITPAGR